MKSSIVLLRATAMIVVLAGAVGSVGLTLYAGRHNHSLILIMLFVLWVLSPFAAMLWVGVTKRWPVLALVVPLASLAVYGYVALGPPRPQPAFTFLIVPAVSWVLIAIVVGLMRLKSERSPRRLDF